MIDTKESGRTTLGTAAAQISLPTETATLGSMSRASQRGRDSTNGQTDLSTKVNSFKGSNTDRASGANSKLVASQMTKE